MGMARPRRRTPSASCIPNQNSGTQKNSVTLSDTTSNLPPWRQPLHPDDGASIAAEAIITVPSNRNVGRILPITSDTGAPVVEGPAEAEPRRVADVDEELPGSGSSSPRSARSASRFWGLKALVPRRSRAAESPGRTRNRKKLKTSTKARVRTALQHLAEDVPARPHPGLRTSFPLRSRSLDVLDARARCLLGQAHDPFAALPNSASIRDPDLGPDAMFQVTFLYPGCRDVSAGLLGISSASEESRPGSGALDVGLHAQEFEPEDCRPDVGTAMRLSWSRCQRTSADVRVCSQTLFIRRFGFESPRPTA